MFNHEDEPYDIGKLLNFLVDFDKCKEEKRESKLSDMLTDKKFMKYLFNPPKDANVHDDISKMYGIMIKPKVLKCLIDVLADDPSEYSRSAATFLSSLCGIAIEDSNSRLEEAKQLRRDGQISTSDQFRIDEKCEKTVKIINNLMKLTKKIVKGPGKKLARNCNLPKETVITLLHSVPDIEYIDKFKVGFYLNQVLNIIYNDVDSTHYDTSDTDWKLLFSKLFGKDNVIEASTFILLEGVHRINDFKSKEVRDTWNQLTKFALKELENSPDAVRTQMIELYIKRIDKMFANKNFDLRINLLSLLDDNNTFPHLANTIDRYKEKIRSIVDK